MTYKHPATPTGWQVVNAADTITAKSAIKADFFKNVKDYGAVGDGVTDDTAAITAAHTALLAANGKGTLVFPEGNYVYNGTGLDFYPNRPIRVMGVGAGQGAHPSSYGTTITLGSNSYFLDIRNYLYFLQLRDIRFVGGLGALRHTYNNVNVSNQKFMVQNCHFYGYTECAIATDAVDMPYWIIENCFFEAANASTTIGVALGPNPNQSILQNCSFVTNRIHVKVKSGNDFQITNCDFLQHTEDNSGGPRVTGVWVVPAVSDASTGENFSIHHCKFGNEHEVATDYKILIADEQAGTHSGARMPVLDANSTGYITGMNITNNSIASNAQNINSSFIYSTTPNVRGFQVCHNVLNGTNPKYVLEFRDPTLVLPNALTRSVFGPFTQTSLSADSQALQFSASNAPGVAQWVDPLMVHQHPNTIRSYSSGSSASYRKLLSTSITAAGQTGGATKATITDALGGTDAITLTLGTSTVTSAYLALSAFTIDMPVWVEVDVANPGDGNAADWIKVMVRDSTSSTSYFHLSRNCRVPSVDQGWVTYAWSFNPRTIGNVPTYFQIGALASASGKTVKVGRVRVYHGNERQLGGQRPTVIGDRASGAATASLLSALASQGIIVDSSTAGSAGSTSGRTIQTLNTSATLGSSGDYIILINTSGVPTLPTAVGATGVYTLKNISQVSRSVLTTDSQTIENSASYALPPGASIFLVSDGSNWRII